MDMVDVRDLRIHFVTPDAVAQGRHAPGRYLALCGADVLPASLTEPGNKRYEPCVLARVPSHRTGN